MDGFVRYHSGEVEHVVDRIGDGIERSAADFPQPPIVFDQTEGSRLWSVNVSSTEFGLAQGETTTSGVRTPYPQRPFTGRVPEFGPGSCGVVPKVPQALVAVSASWLCERTVGD